jgi:hypothetical protein
MNHTEKAKVILFLRPNAEFFTNGDEVTWLDQTQTEPTKEEIEASYEGYLAKVENDKLEAEVKKAEAESKLIALGLTTDDLKALGL